MSQLDRGGLWHIRGLDQNYNLHHRAFVLEMRGLRTAPTHQLRLYAHIRGTRVIKMWRLVMPFGLVVLCQMPPLLCKEKWAAELTKCQHGAVLFWLFSDLANLLGALVGGWQGAVSWLWVESWRMPALFPKRWWVQSSSAWSSEGAGYINALK